MKNGSAPDSRKTAEDIMPQRFCSGVLSQTGYSVKFIYIYSLSIFNVSELVADTFLQYN